MPTEVERIFPDALRAKRKEIVNRIAELESTSSHPDPEFNIHKSDEAVKLRKELMDLDNTLMEMSEPIE